MIRGLVLACGLLVAFSACSRDDAKKPAQVELGSRFNRQPYPTPPPSTSVAAKTDDNLPWPSDADGGAAPPPPPSPVATAARGAVDAGVPGSTPDDAALERARLAAGGCFASLPAGPGYGPPQRSAHIVLTVVPTGTVTRAIVSSGDTDDESVLACIKQQTEGARFSDNGGGPLRTYEIDVRVFAPGSAGAH